MVNKKSKSHANDALSTDLTHVGGNSRKWGDASLGTKAAVIFAIEDQALKYGLSDRDVANLLAIAKVESGFNPDAATTSTISSASGVFQITDSYATDLRSRLSGRGRIDGIELGDYDRFDLLSNIQYGVAAYLDKKAAAGGTSDVGEIYEKYNTSPDEYNKYLDQLRGDSDKFFFDSGPSKNTLVANNDPDPPTDDLDAIIEEEQGQLRQRVQEIEAILGAIETDALSIDKDVIDGFLEDLEAQLESLGTLNGIDLSDRFAISSTG